MRKKFIILVLVTACMASSVFAQEINLRGLFDASVFGSIDVPTGFTQADPMDAGLNRKLGFDFGAAGEYFFSRNFGGGIDFSYVSFASDEFEGLESDDKLNIIMIGAHFKAAYPLENMIIPYVSAGAGLAMPKLKDATSEFGPETVDIDIKDQIYVAGNIGVMYFVSDMISVFAEGGGAYVPTEDAETMVEGEQGDLDGADFPGNISFVNFKAGINIWFGMAE